MKPHSQTSLHRIADRRVIMPVLGLCIAAVGIPLAFAVIFSFSSVDPSGSFDFGSLDGYRALFAGGRIEEFFKIVVRSATVTAVTMLLSVPSAYWIARVQRSSVQVVVLALLVTPWLVSDMLRAFGWQLVLSPSGPVSSSWTLLTGTGPLENLRYHFTTVVIGLVSAMLPAGILSVLAAIPDRSRNEWLAAAELGSPRDVFRLMVLGRAKAGIVLGAGAVFTLSCFASAEPRFLDGPTQTSVQSIAASLVNVGVPALLAFGTVLVLLVCCCCGLTGAVYRIACREKHPHGGQSRSWRGAQPVAFVPRFDHSRRDFYTWVWDTIARLAPALAGLASIALCCAPLLAVATEAFWQPSSSGGRWTFENFQLMFASEDLMKAFTNSVYAAGLVSVITSVFAFILSLVVWDKILQWVVVILSVLLVILPGDAYALSFMQFLKVFRPAEGGWVLVIISHVLWALPFATGTLILANRHLNKHTLEASLEYAKGPMSVIIRFIGRINAGRLAAVALLAGTLSLNEYLRTAYLGGGLLTIGNVVHGRLTAGLLRENRGVFAVEFLVLIASIAAVVVLLLIGVRASRDEMESRSWDALAGRMRRKDGQKHFAKAHV